MNLTGKIALVTGAGRGIGREIAVTLMENGAFVLINDLNKDLLAEAKSYFSEKKLQQFDSFDADISDESQVKRLFSYIDKQHGGLDILINNAGISPKNALNQKLNFNEIEASDWDHVMSVNLKSVFLCSKHALPLMVRAERSKIINIGSVMGKLGSSGSDDGYSFPLSTSGAHYCVSKAGVICLTKCLAREFSQYNINVNCVCPGAVSSGMGKFDVGFIEKISKQISMGRLATQREIANAVLFLSSSLSDYITGEIMDVNGGWFMD